MRECRLFKASADQRTEFDNMFVSCDIRNSKICIDNGRDVSFTDKPNGIISSVYTKEI